MEMKNYWGFGPTPGAINVAATPAHKAYYVVKPQDYSGRGTRSMMVVPCSAWGRGTD